jgi:iron complex transport system substrate-binding protein
VGLVNGGGLALALLVALAGGLDRTPRGANPNLGEPTIRAVQRVRLPSGEEGIVDAGGHALPLRPYRRIVSTSTLTDRLLADLSEPDRVLAFSTAGARTSAGRWRYAGKPDVDGLGALEPIIALKPDLVLMNASFGDGNSRMEKLRAAGIEVFNLGELHGLTTLLPMAEVIGELLGAPERGARYARGFLARFERVATPLGARPRRRALFVVVIAGNIYGGTAGTSYHDVLAHAGLDDAAAGSYRNWPQYSAEQVMALDPEVLVTKDDVADGLCARPGLDRLRACRTPGHVLTVPADLLDDPGPGMLEAAEILFAKAYPELAPKDPR